MAPSSPHNDSHHLPRLSSPNVRKLDSSKADKTDLLRTYIRSQEAHLSSYAVEGKSISASWRSPTAEPTANLPKRPARDFELESGFGTPILKPRVLAKPTSDPAQAPLSKRTARCVEESSIGTPKKATNKNDPMVSYSKISKENRGDNQRHPAKDTPVHRGLRQSILHEYDDLQPANEKKASKRTARRKPEAKVKVGEDQEHSNRLAERRERRRAKKAIVDPHRGSDLSASEGSGDDLPDQRKKKKEKKEKGLNIPAGLALMHGFSAKNIGKNRLTMRLDSTVGVFNKGKASTKTAVKKTKTNPRLNMFSEERFLSRTNPTVKHVSPPGSHISEHRLLSDPSETDVLPSDGTARPTSRKPDLKPKRARSQSSSSPSQSHQQTSEHERPVKRIKDGRQASPVWDIEMQDGQLPSDDTHSGVSGVSGDNTKPDGTVLLDTRRLTSRWNTSCGRDVVKEKSPEVLHIERSTPARSEASSIGPSHSVSQVALQRNQGCPTMLFSKYWDVPSHSIAKENHAHAQDITGHVATSQNSHDRSSNHERSPIPQAINGELAVMSMPSVLGDVLISSLQAPAGSACALPMHGPAQFATSGLSPAVFVTHLESPASPLGLPDGLASPVSPGPPVTELIRGSDDHPQAIAYDSVRTRRVTSAREVSLGLGSSHWRETSVDDFNSAVLFMSDPCNLDYLQGAGDELDLLDDSIHLSREPHVLYSSPSRGSAFYDLRDYPNYPEGSAHLDDDYLCAEDHGIEWPQEQELDVDPYGVAQMRDDVSGMRSENLLVWSSDDVREEQAALDRGTLSYGLEYNAATSDSEAVAFDVAQDVDQLTDEEPMESEGDAIPSVLGSLQRFSQGRALLLGVSEVESGAEYHGGSTRVSQLEEDVARNLRGHWLPQRF